MLRPLFILFLTATICLQANLVYAARFSFSSSPAEEDKIIIRRSKSQKMSRCQRTLDKIKKRQLDLISSPQGGNQLNIL